METIFALATARGKAGVAVVRISGPGAWAAAEALAGPLPAARRAALRRLTWGGEVLDEALVLPFAPGASFTGEAVVELHLHGSGAVVAGVLRALSALPGLRPAGPGEFTRRALEGGRLDLAEVEGLADLIDAETEAQRRQALRVMQGAVGARVGPWRAALVRAAALVEATIDFADEEVPVDVTPEVRGLIAPLLAELRAELTGMAAAERVREGFEVAILGAPNAGKSTLLNALARREAAITSPIAGTTRDVIEVRMDVGGLAVTFLDTAGLRETADPLERLGIDRARARAEAADLRLFLLAPGEGMPEGIAPAPGDIVLRGKADVAGGDVSGRTGQGVAELLSRIAETLGMRVAGAGVLTRERHRLALTRAIGAMESAADGLGKGRDEIVALHLREAALAMESLLGRVDAEALLDEIFASFCIGK
jgi:tRNA modification GTPase